MGKYVNSTLISSETVIQEAKYHWFIFFSLRMVLLLPVIDYLTSEFVVTNKRVVMKTGLIQRKIFEMNIAKIESVNVLQSIIGRLFNYGTVVIIGTGGSREMYYKISRPLDFKSAFQKVQN